MIYVAQVMMEAVYHSLSVKKFGVLFEIHDELKTMLFIGVAI